MSALVAVLCGAALCIGLACFLGLVRAYEARPPAEPSPRDLEQRRREFDA